MSTRIREHAPALRAWVRITLLASLVLAAGSARAEGPAPGKADTAKAESSRPATSAVKPTAVKPAAVKPATVARTPAGPAKVGTRPAPAKPATVAPAQSQAPATPAVQTPAKPAAAPAGTQAQPATAPAGTQAKPAASPNKPAPATKAPPTKAAPGTPVPPTAKAQAGNKTATSATTVSKSSLVVTRPLAGAKTPASGVAPGGPKVTAPVAQLDEHITYQYNTLGRRDPFQSMLEGEFVGVDVGGDAPPDIGGLTVVGIVWGDADRFALCEDARGNSHILRKGDKVMNGYVQELKRDGVVMNLTVDNQSESVTIPLTRKGEKKNASR